MKKMTANILAVTTVALLASFGSLGAVAQDRACLSKQDIQERVADGLLPSLAEAMQRAGVKGRPLSPPQVCDIDGSDHYIVNMMDSDGESESVTLNAEDGSQ